MAPMPKGGEACVGGNGGKARGFVGEAGQSKKDRHTSRNPVKQRAERSLLTVI